MTQQKNIWILQTGEPVHTDTGNPRPMRAMNLANKLVKDGHRVTLWTANFYHQKKLHRNQDQRLTKVNELLSIQFIQSSGYRSNIGLARLSDHAQLAFNLSKLLKGIDKADHPDAIFIGYPPIEAAYVLSKWAIMNKIPYIVDVKDKWPDIFVDVFPHKMRGLGKLIFSPYIYMASYCLRNAKKISTVTSDVFEWCEKYRSPVAEDERLFAPLVTRRHFLNEKDRECAIAWWEQKQICFSQARKVVSFVGSISDKAFDFTPVSQMASALPECDFIICGFGEDYDNVKESMASLDNTYFPGPVDISQMAYLMEMSTATIAPYILNDSFKASIPNKVVDSFVYSRPIITCIKGDVEKFIDKYECGISYSPTNPESSFAELRALVQSEERFELLSNGAKKVYDEFFDFDMVYDRIIASLVD